MKKNCSSPMLLKLLEKIDYNSITFDFPSTRFDQSKCQECKVIRFSKNIKNNMLHKKCMNNDK